MPSKPKRREKQKQPEKKQPEKKAENTGNNRPLAGPSKLLVLSLCLLISFVFYGNTIKNGYSMDDELVTLGQKNVEKGIAGIPAIFSTRYSVNEKQNYEYRPVVLASFAIEYQMFGPNPSASHFFNIVFYALAAFLVYRTVLKLFPSEPWWLAGLTSIIFLVHPLHSEVVASLKNRDEILAMIFALLSLGAFLNFADSKKKKYVLFGLLFLLLGLYSKKSCMPYMFIIPFAVMYVRKVPVRKVLLFTVVIGMAVLAGFATFKTFALGTSGNEAQTVARNTMFFENPLYEGSYGLAERLMIAIATFGFYIKMLFAPYPLVAYYGYNTFDGFDFGFYHIAGLAGFALMVWAAFRYYHTNRPLVFGMVLFLAGISMFTNLLVPAVGIVAERFAFEASFGFSLVLSSVLLMLPGVYQHISGTDTPGTVKITPVLRSILAAVVLVSGIIIIPRNNDWNSQISLYRADIEKVPRSAKLNSLLGTHYARELQATRLNGAPMDPIRYRVYVDSSIHFFRQALDVYPGYPAVNNNLGTVYINYRYNLDSSIYYIGRAIKEDSTYVEALGNYAVSMESKAKIESEKLKWLNNSINKNDTTGRRQPLQESIRQLNRYNHVFDAVSQMKKALISFFSMVVKGQQPQATGRQNMLRLIGQYTPVIAGSAKPGIDNNNAYMEALVSEYGKIKNSGRYDRLRAATDSVTAVYAYRVINNEMGGLAQQLNVGTAAEVLKKRDSLRRETYDFYMRSLEQNPDNGNLYAKAIASLQQWKMADELLELNNMVLQKAKFVRKYMIEMNIAQAHALKEDYAGLYKHTLSAIRETDKLMKRLVACRADFTAIGNRAGLDYFTEATQVNKRNIAGYASGIIQQLRSLNMETEAASLEQEMEKIMKSY